MIKSQRNVSLPQNTRIRRGFRLFVPGWKEEFEWVEYDDQKMYCRSCKKYDRDGPFVTGTTYFRKDTLKAHDVSRSHIKNYDAEKCGEAKVGTSVAESSLIQLKSHVAERVKVMFRTVHAMALKGRPFTDFLWICELDKSKGLDIGSDYVNDKQAALFTHYVAKAEMEKIKSELSHVRIGH